ncbi:hypothetical protein FACS1894167_01420 [Synergistales bacterium]|nr:hypothetical protein FACS1894167_01420 [Synergistales bacterium]GHV56610.1 hypothetical protein FACS1894216_20650 [Synergistales bacterium]
MLLRKTFTFDAAHNLTSYHGACEKLHGHTYKMTVTIEGTPGDEGMIVDFADVKEIVRDAIISKFDHSYLNDTFAQPSAENIARFAFNTLSPLLRGLNYELRDVELFETQSSSVVFSREDLLVPDVNQRVDAVMFDFDMTLADSGHAVTECMNIFAEAKGLPKVTQEVMLNLLGRTVEEEWMILYGRFEPDWIDFYRQNISETEFSLIRLFDGASETLSLLREMGLITGIISNRGRLPLVLERVGLLGKADVVVGINEVKNPKPAPDALLLALERVGVSPENALYVGDTDIDIKAAIAAGMRCIGMTTGNFDEPSLYKAGAWRVCADVREIPLMIGGKA